MNPPRSERKFRRAITLIVILAGIAASVFLAINWRNHNKPLFLVGAIVQQNEDTRKQSPIADVVVTAGNDLAPAVKSNTSGYFKVSLPKGLRRGQPIRLQFRQPKYQPVDLDTTVGDTLYVIHMVPLQTGEDEDSGSQPPVAVTNIVIRYSSETSVDFNVGTGVTTFQVSNQGAIRCDPSNHTPCSPDGKWKASIGSASLDAGQGNNYQNARVFCIAGPCPFTKLVNDDFSHGGQKISVSVLNWSDTTTFLFQAEVFRRQVSDIVRESYPVVYGRTFNFSLPASAEGASLEAELNRTSITFPLGPDPKMSWATCSVIFDRHRSKSYRCQLRPGFKFP
jgi:hypothetical protein